MKYIKLLWFDLKNGLFRRWWVLLIFVAFGLCNCQILYNLRSGPLSFADYLLFAYGGAPPYVPENNPVFPFLWFFLYLLLFFVTLRYPYEDLEGYGQQVLLRMRGRTAWWLSKSVWCGFMALCCQAAMIVGILLYWLARGMVVRDAINENVLNGAVWTPPLQLSPSASQPPLLSLLAPVLLGVALCLVQMTLSLFLTPVFSFVATSAWMCLSYFLYTPLAVGNLTMLFRSEAIFKYGFPITWGPLAALGLGAAAVGAGILRFRHYDIYNQKKEGAV